MIGVPLPTRNAGISLARSGHSSGLHTLIDVKPPIAHRARKYREHYILKPIILEGGKQAKRLTTPDAIHLATAVIYGCQTFFTFDGLSNEKNDIGLLWLGNKAGDDELVICSPSLAQMSLPLN